MKIILALEGVKTIFYNKYHNLISEPYILMLFNYQLNNSYYQTISLTKYANQKRNRSKKKNISLDSFIAYKTLKEIKKKKNSYKKNLEMKNVYLYF